jgi:hypothetical protein
VLPEIEELAMLVVGEDDDPTRRAQRRVGDPAETA